MAEDNELPAHRATYDSFMTMLKWGTLAAALIAAFFIYLLVS